MFSPPPSPRPSWVRRSDHVIPDPVDEGSASSITKPGVSGEECKRMTGRKTKWAVILVPFVLVLITASTRFATHPIMFDFLSKPPSSSAWRSWPPTVNVLRPHKRHPYPGDDGGALSNTSASKAVVSSSTAPPSSSSKAQTTTTSTAHQSLPTIPSSPPVLPTPFPQPLDTSLQNNFSSVSCYNFFLNMTNTLPFRSCRPFSLLLQSSEAFIQAQDNITMMNDIIWGTCNTQPGQDQCTQNMAWFASGLQTSCSQDLDDRNSMAVNTLMGLQAFPLMFSAGCLSDPASNSYCYVSAVINPNPSDLYFYQLPLGVKLPNSTASSCSACTKNLLGLYETALGNGAELVDLDGLRATYPAAASLAGSECGQGYAVSSVVTSHAIGVEMMGPDMALLRLLGLLLAVFMSFVL